MEGVSALGTWLCRGGGACIAAWRAARRAAELPMRAAAGEQGPGSGLRHEARGRYEMARASQRGVQAWFGGVAGAIVAEGA